MGVCSYNLLSGSLWNEQLLQDVCAGLAEELQLAPDAPGGMVDFRRTLTLSFFFKFYLTVLQKLGKEGLEDVSVGLGKAQTLCGTFVWGFGSGRETAVDQVVNLLFSSGHQRARDTGRWDQLGG